MSQQKVDKLCVAASRGQEDVAERLIHKLKRKALSGRWSTGFMGDGSGWGKGVTPLYLATGKGHTRIVQRLIGAKALVDQFGEEENKYTPLFLASQKGHLDTVNTLVAANAGLDLQSSKGVTALCQASQE